MNPECRPKLGPKAHGGAQYSTSGDDDDDDGFAALLREQEEFERSQKPPAATCVRVSRDCKSKHSATPKEESHRIGPGANEDCGPKDQEQVGRKRKPSFFKQLRQLGGSKSFGLPGATPHPEVAALPDLDGPQRRELSCLGEEVVERRCPKQEVQPESATAGVSPAPAAGFPLPVHRATGKNLGRQIATARASIQHAGAASLATEEEDAEIDAENCRALGSATPEEIYEWQQQLLQQFGEQTCDFLKKRGQQRIQHKSQLASGVPACMTEGHKARSTDDATKRSVHFDIDVGSAAATCGTPVSQKQLLKVELDLNSLDGDIQVQQRGPAFSNGTEALQSLVGGCLDRTELQKLQWTTPAGPADIDSVVADPSLPPEPAGKVIQLLRFDFDGRVCLRIDEDDAETHLEAHHGLHHHGAESSQAGYTLAELLLLSRSASTPQRALALGILATTLLRAHVPSRRDVLTKDAALHKAGEFSDAGEPGTHLRAGFGMGLTVFFLAWRSAQ